MKKGGASWQKLGQAAFCFAEHRHSDESLTMKSPDWSASRSFDGFQWAFCRLASKPLQHRNKDVELKYFVSSGQSSAIHRFHTSSHLSRKHQQF